MMATNNYALRDLDDELHVVTGFDKVRRQIDNILNIATMSFPGHPSYFSDAGNLLFELNDEITHIILTDKLRYAIIKHITEVTKVEVQLEAEGPDLKAIIRYYNTELQQNDTYRYPLMYSEDNN